MKTVSVSEIIRTAQLGDTLYVLASEAEAEIAYLKQQYADSCSESDSMLPEIKELRTQLTEASELVKQLQDALSVTAANLTAAAEREKTLINTVNMHKKVLETATERERVLVEALLLEREECAKIAEKYEPDEKLDYVTYASREIRLRDALAQVKSSAPLP